MQSFYLGIILLAIERRVYYIFKHKRGGTKGDEPLKNLLDTNYFPH